MSPPDTARRRAYWPLPLAAAMLLLPATSAGIALIAMLVCAVSVTAVRAARARHARGEAAEQVAGSILLGSDTAGGAVRLSDRQLSAHGLILGASGAGKSTALLRILTEQIRRGQPVVAVDMKGSPGFAEELANAAAVAGRRFRVWSLDGPEHWNPLQHGNATALKDKLISSERFTEPHYQRAAERYVQTVLQILQDSDPDSSATLEQVVELMDPRRLGAVLRRVPGPRAIQVQDYLASLTPDQSVYWALSAQVGAMVIQDLVAAAGYRLGGAARSGAGANPLAIVGIDEFSALRADNVLALLARGREAGVSVLLATQELADLDRAGRGLRDQVLGVTAVKLVHRQDVPASAQLVAQMAGMETVWEHTYQLGRGPLAAYSTTRGTRRQVERFAIHPDEIKRLPTGHAVAITKTPTAAARVIRVSPPDRTGPELG